MSASVMSAAPAIMPHASQDPSINAPSLRGSPDLQTSRSAEDNRESPSPTIMVESDPCTEGKSGTDTRNVSDDRTTITSTSKNAPPIPALKRDITTPPPSISSDAKSESNSSPTFVHAESDVSSSPMQLLKKTSNEDRSRLQGNAVTSYSMSSHIHDVTKSSNASRTRIEQNVEESDNGQDCESKGSAIHGKNLNLISCEDCGLICAGQSHYQVHVRSHTGERPFKCAICGVAFTQKGNLRRHYKIHSDEKPFQCPVCSYRCRRRDALNGHMRIHSDVRPYRCVYCARSYKSRQSLKEHEFQCPYKKDPVLQVGKTSPSENQKTSEEHLSPSMSDSNLSPNGSKSRMLHNTEENARHSNLAVAAIGAPMSPGNALQKTNLLQIDPYYIRSLAGTDFKNHPSMTNMFSHAMGSSQLSSSKRKATTPQKIPRFHDMPAGHPLIQLQSASYARDGPMISPVFKYLEKDRSSSTSPNSISMPTMPLPFMPSSILSTMFHQQQLRQVAAATAALKQQDGPLDFSVKPVSSEQSHDLHRKESGDLSNGKLSGSAKRKRPRPRYLNDRFIESEMGVKHKKNTREEPSLNSNVKCEPVDSGWNRNPDFSTLDLRKPSNQSRTINGGERGSNNHSGVEGRNTPSPESSTIRSGDASLSGLRVFSISKEVEASDDNMKNASEMKAYFCQHCRCIFLDHVMYAIHAGCHGFQDPFECNVCGFQATDRFQFQSHMTRSEHYGRSGFPNCGRTPTMQPEIQDGGSSTAAREYLESLLAYGRGSLLQRTIAENLLNGKSYQGNSKKQKVTTQ
uniref:ikaros family zinc finger protein-like isoform X2 n=1 Tax=Styela clava TaxID=7725 RepID=UPI001939CC34|nr:ikaros family zinc finger protein-like isoform X2 [Styela clava]